MTVICWDGTTLAADKRICYNGTAITTTKIFRAGDCLVGITGQCDFAAKFIAWFEAGADPEKYQQPQDESIIVVIGPDRSMRIFERTGFPVAIEGRYIAAGSGKDFALAAMHLGHDARTAVEVACAFDGACGNGIDTLTFESVHIRIAVDSNGANLREIL